MLRLRTLLAGLVAAALSSAGLVAGQGGSCVTPDFGCTELVMASPSGSSPEITVTLYLYFEASDFSVCDLAAGSTIGTIGGNGYAISDARGSFSGSVIPTDNSNSVLKSISLTFTATQSTSNSGGTGTISTPAGASLQTGGLTVNFPPLTGSATSTLGGALINSCTAARGDPLFSGFRGQEFYVGGEDGQVMNMLSTFNMQLNGRFVTLNEGAAIKPAEQEKLRLLSQARHTEQPEVAAFPRTTAWSHPGNYFGEAGVALLDNNRLYVKAGSFESGFAKVALNGRPLAVSSEFVVLGSGANTTYIQRVSAHEVMVRTVNVEYTLTNSDNFLNVEDVHLERGYRQHNKFSGMLGNTVDAKWTWNKQDEDKAIVQSNDIFAHNA